MKEYSENADFQAQSFNENALKKSQKGIRTLKITGTVSYLVVTLLAAIILSVLLVEMSSLEGAEGLALLALLPLTVILLIALAIVYVIIIILGIVGLRRSYRLSEDNKKSARIYFYIMIALPILTYIISLIATVAVIASI